MTALRKVVRTGSGQRPAPQAMERQVSAVQPADPVVSPPPVHLAPKPVAASAAQTAALPAPKNLPAQKKRPAAPPPQPAAPQPANHAPLAAFLDLEHDFRKARTLDALRLALVTGGRKLAAYDCALLLECPPPLARRVIGHTTAEWRVVGASGASSVDRQAPFLQAFEAYVRALCGDAPAELGKAQSLTLDVDCAGATLHAFVKTFPHLIWIPIHHPDGSQIGAIAAFRAAPWPPDQATLLAGLVAPYGHAWAALVDSGYNLRLRLQGWLAHARMRLGALVLLALLLAFPIRFSVLAPAEVVGAQPTLISAPLEGIIREVRVNPGDQVAEGTVLFSLVDTKLRNDVEIAQKGRAVALAKYQRTVQNAVANRRDSQDIAVTRADLEVADAELALAEDMLRRAEVTAPRAGVVVYSAKADWLGKPVTTGERVMDIVDPLALELKIDLGVSDAMALTTGMPVKLFLDGNPLAPAIADISRIGYRPVANAERQLVYRVFADFADGAAAPHLGARGTARIDGKVTPLGFYLFRRPLAALRQKLGI